MFGEVFDKVMLGFPVGASPQGIVDLTSREITNLDSTKPIICHDVICARPNTNLAIAHFIAALIDCVIFRVILAILIIMI